MRVLVFIAGPFPSDEDRELAAKHGTTLFRNGWEAAGAEVHDLAVSVDPGLIPEGYTTSQEAAVEVPVTPTRNPVAPATTKASGIPFAPAME